MSSPNVIDGDTFPSWKIGFACELALSCRVKLDGVLYVAPFSRLSVPVAVAHSCQDKVKCTDVDKEEDKGEGF